MSHGIVTLARWSFGEMGTFGELQIGTGSDSQPSCHTLELSWRNNQRRVSCIPCGAYSLKQSYYHSGGYDCWEVCDVLGRDEIKIHIGNTIDDVLGCIVLGTELGWVDEKWAVTSSRYAFRRFMESMTAYETATLFVSLEHDGLK